MADDIKIPIEKLSDRELLILTANGVNQANHRLDEVETHLVTQNRRVATLENCVMDNVKRLEKLDGIEGLLAVQDRRLRGVESWRNKVLGGIAVLVFVSGVALAVVKLL